MKIENGVTQNNIALAASIGTATLILGSYNLYALMKMHPSSYGSDFPSREPLYKTVAKITPTSTATALMSAGMWRVVTGGYIANSGIGLGILTAAYSFPTMLMSYANLDQWRLYDDAITITKAVAGSVSAGIAVSLAETGKAKDSNNAAVALGATAIFPAALMLFNYKARNGLETDTTIVAKALSASLAVAGAVSLVCALRPVSRV